jgi:hypothetical protein
MRDTGHGSSLRKEFSLSSFVRRHIFTLARYWLAARCAIRGYSEALARCDAQQIVTVVASVVLKARAVEQCGSEPSRLEAHQQEEVLTHVAMDGKTLRGTH